MEEFFSRLFDSSDFPARWHCGRWTEGHGWLHVLSDVAVFGAYMAIPIVLGAFITRRRDIPFPRIFWMFVAFIAFCGVGHLVEALIFWVPVYRVSGLLKLATAIASWATVASLIVVMPGAIRLRSPEELERQVEERTKQLENNQEELARLNVELRRVNEELRQYTSIVSHDLQSPLRAIKGFTDILSETLAGSMDESDREYMAHVNSGISRMDQMIRDLLAYSRTGKVAVEIGQIDLNAMLDSIVQDLRVQQGAGQAIVEYEELPTVRGDPNKIRQVLQNLIDNAVKFSGDAAPRITIRGREVGEGWEISVADRGIGFEPRYIDRIFEPFQRLHLPEEYEGTGIGLPIVRRIVRQHGGEIEVDAEPGRGATFTFTLPRDPRRVSGLDV